MGWRSALEAGEADDLRGGCRPAGAAGSADEVFEGPAEAAATAGATPAAIADRRTKLRREIGFIKWSLAFGRRKATRGRMGKKDESHAG